MTAFGPHNLKSYKEGYYCSFAFYHVCFKILGSHAMSQESVCLVQKIIRRILTLYDHEHSEAFERKLRTPFVMLREMCFLCS